MNAVIILALVVIGVLSSLAMPPVTRGAGKGNVAVGLGMIVFILALVAAQL